MSGLIDFRDQVIRIFSRYEMFIIPVLKFILVLTAALMINSNVGFMRKLDNPAIALIVALLASFLPLNLTIILLAVIVTAHMYGLSMECAVVVLCAFLIIYVLYLRFTPRDAAAIILTPILFKMHIPYVIPVTMGLCGTPFSCLSVGCGVIIYYILRFFEKSSESLNTSGIDVDSALSGFKGVIDGIIKNDDMLLMTIAFVITVVVIGVIKRLPISYSWKIAIGFGSLLDLLIVLIGNASMGADVSVVEAIIGLILSLIIGLILEFIFFNVDYSSAEYTQFEDDEYYYYVKALPKITSEPRRRRVPAPGPRRR